MPSIMYTQDGTIANLRILNLKLLIFNTEATIDRGRGGMGLSNLKHEPTKHVYRGRDDCKRKYL